jgi:hypothetical protein
LPRATLLLLPAPTSSFGSGLAPMCRFKEHGGCSQPHRQK